MRRTKDIKCQLLKAVMTVMAMCVMFVCISFTSLAAEGKVTTTSAKIRKEASTSSEAVGSAYLGETYEILNEVTGSDGYVWYQIEYEEDKLGYVRSDLMQKSGTTPSTPSSTVATEVTDVQPVNCTVTASSVNIRSNASTGGDVVTQVREGVVMTINGQAADSEGKTWYRVTFTSDGGDVTGYVRYDFVSVSGEILPVVETPDVQEPEEPDVQEPEEPEEPVVVPTLTKDYDTTEINGVWYLLNNVAGKQYPVEELIEVATQNPEIYEAQEKKIKSQKGWITFFVFLVILLSVAVTLLILKVKDVMDEAYFSAVEKDTIRQRQSQNAKNRNSNVMHTVGNGSGSGTTIRQGSANKTSVPKMNVPKTGEKTPQTVKVSNSADTRAARPAQQKQERPVTEKTNTSKPQQAKQVVSEETKVIPPVTRQEPKKAVDSSRQTWQSKNFMTDDDDDDEFEYGFLDWDEGDE